MYDIWTTKNGIRVIGECLPHLHSCSIGVWVAVGSMRETESENGLSHFIEHLVFKGTKKRSARDIAEEMDQVGGQLNAFTAKDCTCFYAKVIDEDLPLAVDILSDMALHPAFDPTEMEKERGVVLEEIAMGEDEPEDLVHELLAAVQFDGQSLGRTILGPADKIRAYTREDVLSFYHRHYTPGHMVIAIAGHYDKEKLASLLDTAFGAFTTPIDDEEPAPSQTVTAGRSCHNKDTEQMHICLGYPGKAMGTEDVYPLSVVNNMLAGGLSSRLFQKIREELGMVYSIYSYSAGYPGVGAFNVYAGCSPDNARRVLDEMQREIALFIEKGFSKKEFDMGKAQLKSGYIMGLESAFGRMQTMGRGMLLMNTARSPEETIQKIDAITPEDALRVARELLHVKPALAIVGRDAEKYNL